MSNFSDFRLKISPKTKNLDRLVKAFTDVLWAGAWPDDFVEGETVNWSWYKEEHEPAMRKVSKKFPDLLFALEVYPEGEGLGVEYLKYFQDGKMQVVNRPPFPKLDPRKMR